MSTVTREMAEAESIHRNMITTRSDVPKLLVQRTEAEWREEFEKWATEIGLCMDKLPFGFTSARTEEALHVWLAALRLVGAIKEDGK